MNAVGYIRVSTDEQHLGMEAQRASIDAFCLANHHDLVACYQEEDISGATLPTDREGFMAALDVIAEGRASLLLVAKRDRLARDPYAAGMAERLVQQFDGRIISCAGEGTELHPDDPAGVLMRGIADLFAAYDRALIRARTRAALNVKRNRKERLGSIPYGSRAGENGKTLEEDPKEQAAIATIFELKKKGCSITEIRDALEAARIPARGKRWHRTTVHRLLKKKGGA